MSDSELDGDSTSDAMPDLLDQIEHLEGLVQSLKRKVIAGGNRCSAAGAVVAEHQNITEYLDRMKDSALEEGQDIGEEIFSFLLEEHDVLPRDVFWSEFHIKIQALNGTPTFFRKVCLFRWLIETECSMLHEVCELDPPAPVLKTLLDITPGFEEDGVPDWWYDKTKREVNHLACAKNGEYPLHMILKNGGSIAAVRLLVEADKERVTLFGKGCSNITSALHLLLANKSHHSQETFSEILRYLTMVTIMMCDACESPLKIPGDSRKIPLELLGKMLADEGLATRHAVKHHDFLFLLKATCYIHWLERRKGQEMKLVDDISKEVDAISLSEALAICYPCFHPSAQEILKESLLEDDQFLFQKDQEGSYPIHGMVKGHDGYFVARPYCRSWHGDGYSTVLRTILEHAPECAQFTDREGRLPLHIAADSQQDILADSDEERLDLIKMLWAAYPNADCVVDKKTGLAPFALAVRGMDKDKIHDDFLYQWLYKDRGLSISGSFFLLRQNPELISNYTSGSNGSLLNDDAPPAKRPRKELKRD